MTNGKAARPVSRAGAAALAVVALSLAALVGCGDDSVKPPANRPPVIAAQADTFATVGDTLWLRARAVDVDGDSLLYSAVMIITMQEYRDHYLPAALMNYKTGIFWFAPGPRDLNGRRLWFRVNDGNGGLDSTYFEISVRQ